MLENAQRRQPFAMVVDCFDPHEPWSPTQKYIDMYSDTGPDVQNIGVTRYGFAENFTPELLRRLHAIYAGEVTMTDRWLGHFMDRFYELGLDENTVIVLLSDHGYLLGERGYTGKVPSQLHPELAQVPLILVTPEDKAAGEVSQFFASTHDVGPTVLSMLGHRFARVDGGHEPRRAPGRRAAAREARGATTAACTTASSSARTNTC